MFAKPIMEINPLPPGEPYWSVWFGFLFFLWHRWTKSISSIYLWFEKKA